MSVNCKSSYNCPVEATIDLIGGKYKSVILWHLMDKTLRYSELHRLVRLFQVLLAVMTAFYRLLWGLICAVHYIVRFCP